MDTEAVVTISVRIILQPATVIQYVTTKALRIVVAMFHLTVSKVHAPIIATKAYY